MSQLLNVLRIRFYVEVVHRLSFTWFKQTFWPRHFVLLELNITSQNYILSINTYHINAQSALKPVAPVVPNKCTNWISEKELEPPLYFVKLNKQKFSHNKTTKAQMEKL